MIQEKSWITFCFGNIFHNFLDHLKALITARRMSLVLLKNLSGTTRDLYLKLEELFSKLKKSKILEWFFFHSQITFDSMPEHVQDVIKAKGGKTRWWKSHFWYIWGELSLKCKNCWNFFPSAFFLSNLKIGKKFVLSSNDDNFWFRRGFSSKIRSFKPHWLALSTDRRITKLSHQNCKL